MRYRCQTVYGVDCSPKCSVGPLRKNQAMVPTSCSKTFAPCDFPRQVDLLTCNFDSLNYLLAAADLHQALRRFAANLGPDGHAIFDLVTEHSMGQGPSPTVERAHGPGRSIIRVTHRDPITRLQIARPNLRRVGSMICETHVQRAYSIQEVVAALTGSGLRLAGRPRLPQTLRTTVAGPGAPFTWSDAQNIYTGLRRNDSAQKYLRALKRVTSEHRAGSR